MPKAPNRRPAPPPVDVSAITWEGPEPDYLLGELQILGVAFHVEAVRMHHDRDIPAGKNLENATRVRRALEFIQGEDPVRPQRVRLPGIAGEWLLWITPYCD